MSGLEQQLCLVTPFFILSTTWYLKKNAGKCIARAAAVPYDAIFFIVFTTWFLKNNAGKCLIRTAAVPGDAIVAKGILLLPRSSVVVSVAVVFVLKVVVGVLEIVIPEKKERILCNKMKTKKCEVDRHLRQPLCKAPHFWMKNTQKPAGFTNLKLFLCGSASTRAAKAQQARTYKIISK